MKAITTEKKEKIIITLISIMLGLIIVALVIAGIYFCNTIDENSQPRANSQPVAHYETIDVTVVSNDYRYWYASGSHYYTEITVKSEDGLEQTFELEGMDATRYKGCQEGDVVQAQLCVWENNSGEVIKREIDSLE